MSAFICSPKHFAVLGQFGAGRAFGGIRNVYESHLEQILGRPVRDLDDTEYADLIANTLYEQNIRSVLALYPDDTIESAPGQVGKPDRISTSDWTVMALRVEPIDILKACDCLEYQSCETEDYYSTPACKVLEAIRKAAISYLPGYEDAAWEIAA